MKHNRMSMLGSGSECSDDEPLPKKLKFLDSITDVQSRLDATEEAALKTLILDKCSSLLELCKEVSVELYHSLLDGVAMFLYLLYDKDDLYRVHHSHNVYRQRREFWEGLESKCEPFVKMRKQVYEACKWIVRKKSDLDIYSLLNEYDLATLLTRYETHPEWKPYSVLDYDEYDEECGKVDRYTSLLLEMLTAESTEFQDLLFEIAVEKINVEAFYGLGVSSNRNLFVRGIESFKYFYEHIRLHFMIIFSGKKLRVQREALSSVMPYIHLFDIEFFDGPSGESDMSKVEEYRCRVGVGQCPSVDLLGLIKVAELRRRAEGSRFINRDHFLWAFEKSGWGLRTVFRDELTSRIAAEAHGHPPYHIYMTAFMLAQAEKEPVEVEHLAFAIFFAKDFVISEEEVKQMQEDFKDFRTALRTSCLSPLKDWPNVTDDW